MPKKKATDASDASRVGRPVTITCDGVERVFDIDDPKLPDWVEDNVLTAGGFPYDSRMKRKTYEKTIEALQVELVKLQS